MPNRGNDPGTWDLPVNGDFNAIDGFVGGIQTISVSSSNVTLTAPAGSIMPTGGPTQAQNAVLRFTGALTAGVQVTLPLPGYMIIENLTTGSFVLSFRAVGSGEVIGIGQGNSQRIYNDGTNVRFVNLPDVGTYIDDCGSAVPTWVTACTKPPYLNCDGTTFNATTYPYLNSKLGGNTLPDFRGRAGYYLNGGTGRLTSSGAGIDGNTRFAVGGNNGTTLVASSIPTITATNNSQSISVTSSNFLLGNTVGNSGSGVGGGTQLTASDPGSGAILIRQPSSGINSISATYTNSSQTAVQSTTPGVVGGIRLIRAA